MGKYANFYDGVRKLLDKIADALDPDSADVKTANYQTAVLNSLSRIGDKVGDVVSATLPDASTATDGDTLVVDDGEWTIGAGGGGITEVVQTTGGGKIVLDKTWTEIDQAVGAGLVFSNVYEDSDMHQYLVTDVGYDFGSELYYVHFTGNSGDQFFYAATENDYPFYESSPGPEVS